MSDDETNVEETVMLTRRERRRTAVRGDAVTDAPAADAADVDAANADAADADAADAGALDEATIVVDRSVGTRPELVDDAPASPDLDDATVVVSRTETRADQVTAAAEQPAEPAADSLFRAPQSPTPAIYRPRPAPLTPTAPPVVIGGAAPTRVANDERTSVIRQARRWSVYSLLGFVAACAVSVAGLVGLGFVVLS